MRRRGLRCDLDGTDRARAGRRCGRRRVRDGRGADGAGGRRAGRTWRTGSTAASGPTRRPGAGSVMGAGTTAAASRRGATAIAVNVTTSVDRGRLPGKPRIRSASTRETRALVHRGQQPVAVRGVRRMRRLEPHGTLFHRVRQAHDLVNPMTRAAPSASARRVRPSARHPRRHRARHGRCPHGQVELTVRVLQEQLDEGSRPSVEHGRLARRQQLSGRGS
jgi:hypothetical protein